MSRQKKLSLAEMKVGVLVGFALLLLAAAILQQSWGFDLFSKSIKAITYLPDVGGLKPGAPVWLAGIEIGKVSKVSIVPPEIYAGNQATFQNIAAAKKRLEAVDPKQPNAPGIIADLREQIREYKLELRFVEVQLEIRQEFINRISRDSEVSIGSRGLIGDSFIEISPGTYGILPAMLDEFYLIEGIRTTGFREIMTGANDVVANFGMLSDQFKNIALKIDPDRVASGLSETIQDVRLTLQEVDTTFSRANLMIQDLHKGEGTIGKLVNDPAVYNRLVDSLNRFVAIAEQIQSGSGTLGKLINDPSFYDTAGATLRKAETVMDRIEKGEGTLGKLSADPALFEKSRDTMDRMASILQKIEGGEGTMGRLLKDDSLYRNLDQSTSEITKLLYDLRQDPKKYLTIRFRLF